MKSFWPARVRTASAVLFWALGFSPAFASTGSKENTVLYCAAGVIGGVVLFFWGFFQLRTKRLIEDIPTSTIRGMAPGLVEISGQAVNWKPFKGPFTLQECIYYEYLVEQLVSSRKSSHWETISHGDTKNAPFYVRDDTGTVL